MAEASLNFNHDQEQGQEQELNDATSLFPNWFNFSISDYNYEKPDFGLDGFVFTEEFNQRDEGQLQIEPISLEGGDLIITLRTNDRSQPQVPPAFFDYYTNCKQHYKKNFLEYLRSLLSNTDAIKKLESNQASGILPKFFQFQFPSQMKFGQNHICDEGAKECEDRAKLFFHDFGMKLQELTIDCRKTTAERLLNKLKNCRDDFQQFGQQEWINQCKKTSQHNILDQHFNIGFERTPCAEEPKDKESGAKINEDPSEILEDYEQIELEYTTDNEKIHEGSNTDNSIALYKASTFLHCLAIADSKKEIDNAIRKRRSDIMETRAKASELKSKQAEVNARADSIRPTEIAETLAKKFNDLSARINNVQMAQTSMTQISMETKIDLSDPVLPSHEPGENLLLSLTQRLKNVEQRLSIDDQTPLPRKRQTTVDIQAAKTARTNKIAKDTTPTSISSPSIEEIMEDSMDTEQSAKMSKKVTIASKKASNPGPNLSKNGQGTNSIISMDTEQRNAKRRRTEYTLITPSPPDHTIPGSKKVPINAKLAIATTQTPRLHQHNPHQQNNRGKGYHQGNDYGPNAQRESYYGSQTNQQRAVYADLPRSRTNDWRGRGAHGQGPSQY